MITDYMWPNAKAAWRINAISQLSNAADVDVLVIVRSKEYSFDWEELRVSHRLADYDLLIFDPAYNYLNWVNALDRASGEIPFNGTAFNNLIPATYMLRLRKFADTSFKFQDYDVFYHIFVLPYIWFSQMEGGSYFRRIDPRRHFVHWYPGGGYRWNNDTKAYDYSVVSNATLISTQAFTTDYLQRSSPLNPTINVFGGPFLARGAVQRPRNQRLDGQALIVCFTSLGLVEEKGADHYVTIASVYRQRYPLDNVLFLGIGNVPESPHVTPIPAMPQTQLDMLYEGTVDVMFNLDRTNNLNGWPLGLEAVRHGAVLFSTDRNGNNERNAFHFSDGLTVVSEDDVERTVRRLRDYALDSELLQKHSRAIQTRFFELFSYEKQMGRIISEMQRVSDSIGGNELL